MLQVRQAWSSWRRKGALPRAQEEEPQNKYRGVRQKQSQNKQKDKALARVPNLPPPRPSPPPSPTAASCSLSPYWIFSYLPAGSGPARIRQTPSCG